MTTDFGRRRGINTKYKVYAYGLFALVDGATIQDFKLTNVNIDTTTFSQADGDSVAALVGYVTGNATIKNISARGSIKAFDAVGGIVGRWYEISGTATTTDCVNNASIEAYGAKAAGILGFVNKFEDSGKITFTNCKNTGSVSATFAADGLATTPLKNNVDKYEKTNCSSGGTIDAGTNNKDYGILQ